MSLTRVRAVIACAMPEELAPFLEQSTRIKRSLPPVAASDPQRFHTATLGGEPVVLALTGVGLTNAARAATRALEQWAPDAYIVAGTSGGLGVEVEVGDVVAGTEVSYFDADATAFGYLPGQIPQMPPTYDGHVTPHGADHAGLVLSGNSFVLADRAEQVRAQFPGALAVDMETAGAAQVCFQSEQAWLSLRAISDLCGPRAGQQFHIGLEPAAERSFEAVLAWLNS